jgi:hypothetical protein
MSAISASKTGRLFRWPSLWWCLAGMAAVLVLLALFYAEENWRGQRAWRAYHRLLLAKGIDFNWRALAPPPVPDRENFASTPFLAALFDYAPGTHTPRNMAAYNRTAGFAQTGEPYLEQRRAEPIPPMVFHHRTDLNAGLDLFRKKSAAPARKSPNESRAGCAMVVCGTLAQYNSVLEELKSASRRPQARFNLNYDEENTWRVPQPHLPVLKRVNNLLALRASAELALQNATAAAEDAELMFALAESLRNEPFQSSQWARYAMLATVRQIIWEGLGDHRWSDEQLARFQARLQQLWLVVGIERPLRLEQAANNKLLGQIHNKQVMLKSWRFGPGVWNGALPYFLWLMPGGWILQEQVSYNQSFEDKLIPALDGESVRIHSGLVQGKKASSGVWNHRLLSGVLLESAESLLMGAALAQNGRNQAILACALERYRLAKGEFPENLEILRPQFADELPTDVISGKPMKYRRLEIGAFELYSVGWNEKDDGGKLALANDGKAPNPGAGDWVWPTYPEN